MQIEFKFSSYSDKYKQLLFIKYDIFHAFSIIFFLLNNVKIYI